MPGARQVHAEQQKELRGDESEFKALVDSDLAAVNRQAASLRIGFIQ